MGEFGFRRLRRRGVGRADLRLPVSFPVLKPGKDIVRSRSETPCYDLLFTLPPGTHAGPIVRDRLNPMELTESRWIFLA